MSRKKRFVAFGLALLLVGLLVALDIALSARTVDRLTREGIEQSFTISSEANWCAHYNAAGRFHELWVQDASSVLGSRAWGWRVLCAKSAPLCLRRSNIRKSRTLAGRGAPRCGCLSLRHRRKITGASLEHSGLLHHRLRPKEKGWRILLRQCLFLTGASLAQPSASDALEHTPLTLDKLNLR